MKIQYRVGAAIASTALMLSALAPIAFADTTITISGNGKDSENKVEVSNTSNTTITQKNDLDVHLDITSNASTGGNTASGNTGGDVKIKTGDATTETGVLILAGSNKATLPSCGCPSDTEINIQDNGKKSENKVELKNKNQLNVYQKNDADIWADITSKASTGKNRANDNTGGNVKIKTGTSVTTTGFAVISGSNKFK